MTTVYTPPAHPGEALGYELFRRGLTQAEAARLLGVNAAVLSRIVREVGSISPTVAHRLELAGVGKAADWLMMQNHFDLWRASFLNYSDVQPFPPRDVPATNNTTEQ